MSLLPATCNIGAINLTFLLVEIECTLTCMVRKIAIGVSVSAEVIAIVTIVIMTTLAYLSYCCVGELIMSA